MKSVMQHDFSQVPGPNIQRSTFNRSHGYKTTFDSGYLIPVFVDEALPGDTFNCRMTGFSRLATPIVPLMDNMYMDTHFFSIPTRLVWDNWRKFMGEQVNPGDSTDFTVPVIAGESGDTFAPLSVGDYFGLPTAQSGVVASALPFRAMNLVYNEWFRDQNLQNSVTQNTGDGPDLQTDYNLMRRGKRHDYFTSCLPFPQKGPAVSVPLGSTAPVIGIGKANQTFASSNVTSYETGASASRQYATGGGISSGADDSYVVEQDPNNTGFPSIYADLSKATASTINQLREAFQIQKMYEKDARSGTRYAEIIKGHFGVNFQDVRYRPEYLGGGSTPINVTPVPQTSQSGTIGDDIPSPQGTLAAYGTSTFTGHGFTKSFTEHCIILGFVSVRADLTYQNGINRMWSRRTRFDYYFPSLAHLGEQAVLNKEIHHGADQTINNQVFGYQERFGEYRYKPSSITGKFRSTDPQSLDIWHLSQQFTDTPKLDDEFISENPPIDRVIAVPSEPQFIFDSHFDMKCARPMPVYSVPGLIDHF